MYATEFQTVINNPYIKIPEYERFKGQEVRIIVLHAKEKTHIPTIEEEEDFIEYLANNPIKLDKELKFLSREDANER